MVIGTMKGTVYVYNFSKNELIQKYQAHTMKITGMWVMAKKAIITCSQDRFLFLKSRCPDFDDA